MIKVIYQSAILAMSIICYSINLNAQGNNSIGIGTNDPDDSAILEVSSPNSNQGLLLPRVPDTASIANPARALIAYATNSNEIYLNRGTPADPQWEALITMPRRGIIMWSGNVNEVPDGWALCDGQPRTFGSVVINVPDLRGRFIVGVDTLQSKTPEISTTSGEFNYGSIGNSGGLGTVTLTTDQIPSHNHDFDLMADSGGIHSHGIIDPGHTHSINTFNNGTAANNNGISDRADREITSRQTNNNRTGITINAGGSHSHNISGNIEVEGGGQAHENRPPYYVLAFIMKL